MLMNGSIRDIVAFADKAAGHDDERIMRALEIACAKDFVLGLDDGADTILGERGKGLRCKGLRLQEQFLLRAR